MPSANGKKTGLSLKENMLWNSFGSFFYLGCQWLITVLVVRLSDGFDSAGILSLAMSVYNMFSSLAIYRMYTYQVSDVNHENSVGEYFAFRLFTCVIALIAIAAYSALSCPDHALPAIIAYSLYKIASLLIDVLHGLDQINNRMDIIGKSLMAQGLISLAFFCVGMILFQDVAITFLLMMVGIIVVGVVYDLPRSKQFERLRVGISGKKVSYLFCRCSLIVVAAIACGAAASIPRQFLSLYSGSASLGIYASVAAPVAIIQMGASYIYNPLLSHFSTAYNEKRFDELSKLLVKVSFGIALMGIISAFALELLGQPLLALMFGAEIAPYSYLMLPLILCAMVTAYTWFLSDLLVSFRLFRGCFWGNLVALLASLGFSLWLIPQYGMNGVSFAVSACYAIGSACMIVSLLRSTRKGRLTRRRN